MKAKQTSICNSCKYSTDITIVSGTPPYQDFSFVKWCRIYARKAKKTLASCQHYHEIEVKKTGKLSGE